MKLHCVLVMLNIIFVLAYDLESLVDNLENGDLGDLDLRQNRLNLENKARLIRIDDVIDGRAVAEGYNMKHDFNNGGNFNNDRGNQKKGKKITEEEVDGIVSLINAMVAGDKPMKEENIVDTINKDVRKIVPEDDEVLIYDVERGRLIGRTFSSTIENFLNDLSGYFKGTIYIYNNVYNTPDGKYESSQQVYEIPDEELEGLDQLFEAYEKESEATEKQFEVPKVKFQAPKKQFHPESYKPPQGYYGPSYEIPDEELEGLEKLIELIGAFGKQSETTEEQSEATDEQIKVPKVQLKAPKKQLYPESYKPPQGYYGPSFEIPKVIPGSNGADIQSHEPDTKIYPLPNGNMLYIHGNNKKKSSKTKPKAPQGIWNQFEPRGEKKGPPKPLKKKGGKINRARSGYEVHGQYGDLLGQYGDDNEDYYKNYRPYKQVPNRMLS